KFNARQGPDDRFRRKEGEAFCLDMVCLLPGRVSFAGVLDRLNDGAGGGAAAASGSSAVSGCLVYGGVSVGKAYKGAGSCFSRHHRRFSVLAEGCAAAGTD